MHPLLPTYFNNFCFQIKQRLQILYVKCKENGLILGDLNSKLISIDKFLEDKCGKKILSFNFSPKETDRWKEFRDQKRYKSDDINIKDILEDEDYFCFEKSYISFHHDIYFGRYLSLLIINSINNNSFHAITIAEKEDDKNKEDMNQTINESLLFYSLVGLANQYTKYKSAFENDPLNFVSLLFQYIYSILMTSFNYSFDDSAQENIAIKIGNEFKEKFNIDSLIKNYISLS